MEGVAGRQAARREGASFRRHSATPPTWWNIRSWSPSASPAYAKVVGRRNVLAGNRLRLCAGAVHAASSVVVWAKLERSPRRAPGKQTALELSRPL